MLTVGNQFPAFSLKATVSEDLDTAFDRAERTITAMSLAIPQPLG